MKRINVALIDSGVNLPGYEFLYENIEINKSRSNLYCDESDHGSSCAKIIFDYGENVYINSIKTLDYNNQSDYISLENALESLLESDVKIINLSLSTFNKHAKKTMKYLCDKMTQKGKIIIAANDNSGKNSYPAQFPNVIGVSGLRTLQLNEYWYNKSYTIQCAADSSPTVFKVKPKKFTVFGGTSKATAMMSALTTRLVYKYGDLDFFQLSNLLEKKATNTFWKKRGRTCISSEMPSYAYINDTKYEDLMKIAEALSNVLEYKITSSQIKKIPYFLQWGINTDNCGIFMENIEKYFDITIIYPIQYYRILELSSLVGIIEEYKSEKF